MKTEINSKVNKKNVHIWLLRHKLWKMWPNVKSVFKPDILGTDSQENITKIVTQKMR